MEHLAISQWRVRGLKLCIGKYASLSSDRHSLIPQSLCVRADFYSQGEDCDKLIIDLSYMYESRNIPSLHTDHQDCVLHDYQ